MNCNYQSIFSFLLSPLIEGGYIILLSIQQTTTNVTFSLFTNDVTSYQIYAIYFKDITLQNRYLLYSSTSLSGDNIWIAKFF